MPETLVHSAHEQPFAGRSVFVTGGTGFVGSHFVERLLALGCTDVRCLVRNEPRFISNLPVSYIKGDLFDVNALEKGIRGADFVVHIAATTRATDWSTFERANVTGTTALLHAVAQKSPSVHKILVTSSLAAVGTGAEFIADENSLLLPVSMYGRSKKDMEIAVAPFMDELPIVIIRPPAVYGPRESDIYTFFKTIRTGFCPIVGMGRDPAISLVYVDDLVTGMIKALLSDTSTGHTYFLGSADHYSWNEIRDASATALKRRVLTIRIPPFLVGPIGTASEYFGKLSGTYPPLNREKAEEIRYACTMCDSSKAGKDFGYLPRTDLWTGIEKTIKWYENEGWLPR